MRNMLLKGKKILTDVQHRKEQYQEEAGVRPQWREKIDTGQYQEEVEVRVPSRGILVKELHGDKVHFQGMMENEFLILMTFHRFQGVMGRLPTEKEVRTTDKIER